MKAFSIVCIVLGSFFLLAFIVATEPPVNSLEETAGMGVITALFLIALGIVGVATAKRSPASSPDTFTVNAYSPRQQTSGFCVSCGAPKAASSAFCTTCGKPV